MFQAFLSLLLFATSVVLAGPVQEPPDAPKVGLKNIRQVSVSTVVTGTTTGVFGNQSSTQTSASSSSSVSPSFSLSTVPSAGTEPNSTSVGTGSTTSSGVSSTLSSSTNSSATVSSTSQISSGISSVVSTGTNTTGGSATVLPTSQNSSAVSSVVSTAANTTGGSATVLPTSQNSSAVSSVVSTAANTTGGSATVLPTSQNSSSLTSPVIPSATNTSGGPVIIPPPLSQTSPGVSSTVSTATNSSNGSVIVFPTDAPNATYSAVLVGNETLAPGELPRSTLSFNDTVILSQPNSTIAEPSPGNGTILINVPTPSVNFTITPSPIETANITTTTSYPTNASVTTNTSATIVYLPTAVPCNATSPNNSNSNISEIIQPCYNVSTYTQSITLKLEILLQYKISGNVNVRVDIPQMRYPSVAIELSQYISSFTCSFNRSVIVFSSSEIFDIAVNDWTSHLSRNSSGFIIVTSIRCSSNVTSVYGEKSFLLVNSFTIERSTRTIILSCRTISFAEAVDPYADIDVDIQDWAIAGDEGFEVDETNIAQPSPDADFDEALDSSVGYLDIQDSRYWGQLLPGVSNFSAYQYFEYSWTYLQNVTINSTINSTSSQNSTTNSTVIVFPRRLAARGWGFSIPKFIKNIGKAVSSAVNTIKDAVDKVTERTFTPFSASLAFSSYLGTTRTPWGKNGIVISSSSKWAIYCVDCGANGRLRANSRITFSILRGIKEAYIEATGSLRLSLGIGLVGRAVAQSSYQKQLLAIPLSPLSIPGILTLGPQVSLSTGASYGFSSNGTLLAGVVASWSNVYARISFLGQPRGSGFSPTLTPILESAGDLVANANAWGKMSVEFGLDILNGLYKKTASLNEIQNFYVSTARRNTVACTGLEVAASTNNLFNVDIFGLTSFTIWNAPGPSYRRCFANLPFRKRGLQEDIITIPAGTDDGIPIFSKPKPLGPLRTSGRIKALIRADNPQVTLSRLYSPELDAALQFTENGNIYVSSTPESEAGNWSYFATTGGDVVGDSKGRLLHAYIDSLSSSGVSRLRLSRQDQLPLNSIIINLYDVPTTNSSVPNALVAASSDGTPYFPVVCSYQDQPARVFLISNPETDYPKLKNPDLAQTVTGGNVTDCDFFYFEIQPVNQEQSSSR